MPIARASRDWECPRRYRRRAHGGCFEAKEVSAHRVVQRSTGHGLVVARGRVLSENDDPGISKRSQVQSGKHFRLRG